MTAALDPALLAILACPVTHQSLRLASVDETAVMPPGPEAWLITADGRRAYPIIDAIPRLLPDDAVERE